MNLGGKVNGGPRQMVWCLPGCVGEMVGLPYSQAFFGCYQIRNILDISY